LSTSGKYWQACAAEHRPASIAFTQWSKNGFFTVSGKTTDWIKKKLEGCKNGTDILYHHAKYGDHLLRAGFRRKSAIFLSFVTLWNDEVCDNGNTMMQCNFQNSYGVIA